MCGYRMYPVHVRKYMDVFPCTDTGCIQYMLGNTWMYFHVRLSLNIQPWDSWIKIAGKLVIKASAQISKFFN